MRVVMQPEEAIIISSVNVQEKITRREIVTLSLVLLQGFTIAQDQTILLLAKLPEHLILREIIIFMAVTDLDLGDVQHQIML